MLDEGNAGRKSARSRNSGIVIEENVNPTFSEDDDSDSDIDMVQRFKGSADLEEMYKGITDYESEYSDKSIHYLSEGEDELISLRKRNIEAKKILIQVGEKYIDADQLKECLTYHSLANGVSLWFYRSSQDQVIFLNEEHTCVENFKYGTLVNYKWIGETTTEEHYAMIMSYGKEILDSNDGSTFKPVVRDGNNHIYLIAYKIVNVENKDIWSCFLQLLGEDIDMPIGNGLTLISDQHKGLIEAVKDVMPLAEHRQCARHIYEDFIKFWNVILAGWNIFEVRNGSEAFRADEKQRTCTC
ncbi:pentatricopeptide repeat-containing protein [Tanacetum coccineum]